MRFLTDKICVKRKSMNCPYGHELAYATNCTDVHELPSALRLGDGLPSIHNCKLKKPLIRGAFVDKCRKNSMIFLLTTYKKYDLILTER